MAGMAGIQHQIRQNSMEQQAARQAIIDWEESMKSEDDRKGNTAALSNLPPVRGTEMEAMETGVPTNEENAETEKQRGNTYFKKGDYVNALKRYTLALEYYDRDPLIYSNRAAAHLKLKKWKEAEEDATSCIARSSKAGTETVSKTNMKAFFRRAQARRALSQFEAARKDLEKALVMDPSDKLSLKELEEVKGEIRKKEAANAKRLAVIDDSDDEEDEVPEPAPATTKIERVSPNHSLSKPAEPSPTPAPPSQPEPRTSPQAAGGPRKKVVIIPDRELPKVEVALPSKAPENLIDFKQNWMELQSNKKKALQYWALCEPGNLKSIINPLESKLLRELVGCLASESEELVKGGKEDVGLFEKCAALFYRIPTLQRFDQAIIGEELADPVNKIVDQYASLHPDKAGKLRTRWEWSLGSA